MMMIRPEGPEHADGVYEVEKRAFDRTGEADLCARMMQRGAVTLSLVAVEDDQVVGHVLFSPVYISAEGQPRVEGLRGEGMGPVAVLPERQRQGIGSRLIRAGLEEIRQQGAAVVVVLGSHEYYSRFGFQPAARYGVRFQDANVPAEHFMLIEMRRGVLEGRSGVAYYEPEFDEV